ncbi:ATP-dependent RNA helicase [Candidatus Micrarchaeota archaeon]|nr:MAG: ATP-dependent RNA helicase [Candidatus Micrarchaeota archaeon]
MSREKQILLELEYMTGFEELGIRKELLKAVQDMGFSKPTEIQEVAIPLALQGEDIIGQAQTGSGKTVAFGIPIMESIDTRSHHPEAVVLVPTRELAVQVCTELDKLGKHMQIRTLPVYGGASINVQIERLRLGVSIVVGTPGRIMDHIERGTLRLDKVRIAVLDEADRMLDMGFIDDMDFILSKLPKKRQTMLFSATMPEEIKALSRKYMHLPQEVLVSKDEISVKEIEHTYLQIPEPRARFTAVRAYLKKHKPRLAIIFTRTKIAADNLAQGLRRNGMKAEALHGDLSQRRRDQVMQRFRQKRIQVLVASDLAARGLDICDVSHVINYHLPDEPSTYVHRTGRTGRIGKRGVAFSLALPDQMGLLGEIERFAGISIEEEELKIGKLPPARPGFNNRGFGIRNRERRQHRGRSRLGGRNNPRRESRDRSKQHSERKREQGPAPIWRSL